MMFTLSCNLDTNLKYITANQISLNQDGNFEIVGTSELSSEKKYIKSPYISIFNKELLNLSNHQYKTFATVQNPRLFTHQNGTKILSYYGSKSINNGTNLSYLLELSTDYKMQKKLLLGENIRIKKTIGLKKEGRNITLSYDKKKLNIELKGLGHPTFKTPFALNEEPSIPTDLELTKNNVFLFSGIQNGFNYPDGYDYNEMAAYGFIGAMNQDGNVLKHASYQQDQHVFFNDIELAKKSIIVTGTKQEKGSSMNLLMVSYNDSLEIITEKSFIKKGFQYGIKTIQHDEHYYTLIADENPKNHKKNLSLMKSDHLLEPQWIKEFPSDYSTEPVDIIITNQHIYCLINVTSENSTSIQSEIYMLSMDGEFVKKQTIQ